MAHCYSHPRSLPCRGGGSPNHYRMDIDYLIEIALFGWYRGAGPPNDPGQALPKPGLAISWRGETRIWTSCLCSWE